MGSLPPDKLAIGRALLAGGPITQEQLQRELEGSQKAGTVLGKALLQSGFPTDEEVVYPLLARLRIPKINARKTTIPLETIRLVPEEVARRHRVLPLDQIGQILVVVMPDVGQEAALAEVRRVTGLFVTPIQCTPEGFDEILTEYYQNLSRSGLGAAPSPNQPAPPPPEAAHAGSGHSASNGTAPLAGSTNGSVRAIPAGAPDEDWFWKRYMSGGPVPAEDQLM
jgi:hypothetical protein